jgi:hypothetical protein
VLVAAGGLEQAAVSAEDLQKVVPRRVGRRVAPLPIRLDCTADSPGCQAFKPVGDSADFIPGYGASPFRGFADPSIRKDPDSHRLWMAYSWPHVQPAPSSETGIVGVVDIHLARSEDGGDTWLYDDPLWTSETELDPGSSGLSGFSSYEVVSLGSQNRDNEIVWYGARLRYFVPDSGAFLERRGDSFLLEIVQAGSPPELASAVPARLGGAITSPGWGVDVNLSALAPEVSGCTIWNEPALHVEGETLYLAAVCLVFDLRSGERVPAEEHIALFATEPSGEVQSWPWRYVGRLAGRAEAAELGAETLTQVDLVRGRNGRLLALLTPNRWDPDLGADLHDGCRVVEVAGLDPPVLARTPRGALRVRVSITASDLDTYGPAASGYDPASSTGIVFVRREWSAADMVWSLHRTGLHP